MSGVEGLRVLRDDWIDSADDRVSSGVAIDTYSRALRAAAPALFDVADAAARVRQPVCMCEKWDTADGPLPEGRKLRKCSVCVEFDALRAALARLETPRERASVPGRAHRGDDAGRSGV